MLRAVADDRKKYGPFRVVVSQNAKAGQELLHEPAAAALLYKDRPGEDMDGAHLIKLVAQLHERHLSTGGALAWFDRHQQTLRRSLRSEDAKAPPTLSER